MYYCVSMTEKPGAALTYSVPETAGLLGVSPPVVYRLVHAGHLDVIPEMKTRLRVTAASIRRLVGDREGTP